MCLVLSRSLNISENPRRSHSLKIQGRPKVKKKRLASDFGAQLIPQDSQQHHWYSLDNLLAYKVSHDDFIYGKCEEAE